MLDAREVRGALVAVFRDSGILVTMYHLPAGAREAALEGEAAREAAREGGAAREAALEGEAARAAGRKVSFQLARNTTAEIPPPPIPGLNLPAASKKKRKKKKPDNERDVSETSRTVGGVGETPGEKLARLRKQLGKLEAGEGRLEGRGEEGVGREERGERREELREEIGRIERRIALFN